MCLRRLRGEDTALPCGPQVRGLQGSGKSTLCRALRDVLGGRWVNQVLTLAKRFLAKRFLAKRFLLPSVSSNSLPTCIERGLAFGATQDEVAAGAPRKAKAKFLREVEAA